MSIVITYHNLKLIIVFANMSVKFNTFMYGKYNNKFGTNILAIAVCSDI